MLGSPSSTALHTAHLHQLPAGVQDEMTPEVAVQTLQHLMALLARSRQPGEGVAAAQEQGTPDEVMTMASAYKKVRRDKVHVWCGR